MPSPVQSIGYRPSHVELVDQGGGHLVARETMPERASPRELTPQSRM
jgi:hypothetical protein